MSLEQKLNWLRRVCEARNAETMRVGQLIADAMAKTDSEEVEQALLELAEKVLRP